MHWEIERTVPPTLHLPPHALEIGRTVPPTVQLLPHALGNWENSTAYSLKRNVKMTQEFALIFLNFKNETDRAKIN